MNKPGGNQSQSNVFTDQLFLYGPPLSGKSTIGRQLAQSLALPFLDLDERIADQAGLSIPEIFATEGEHGFRARERSELINILDMEWGVIALGGGALLDSDNRTRVEESGTILCLSPTDEELLQRLGTSSVDRPLLHDKNDASLTQARLIDLLASRAHHYASFENQIAAGSISPSEIAWQIQLHLGAFHINSMIPLDNRRNHPAGTPPRPHPLGYDVRVKMDSLDSVGDLLNKYDLADPIVLVSDENVGDIYLSRVMQSLHAAGFTTRSIIIPPGESSKHMGTVSILWQEFINAGLERGSTVVALGGGVVGDLVGFAAATYMRGTSWVILPTSLLAMVDASLGGKTGADLPQGKNLIGAFHAPHFVLADPKVLDTLPTQEIQSGMAEVVKAGIIADPELFFLCRGGLSTLTENWGEVISRGMAVKVNVIEADPYEAGLRKILNLGHTIGHAVEMVSKFELRHGEAISIGMVVEAQLAEQIGLAEQGLMHEIKSTLSGLGLPTEIPNNLDRQAIFDAMLFDKKRTAGTVRFALPVRVGEVKPDVVIEDLTSLEF